MARKAKRPAKKTATVKKSVRTQSSAAKVVKNPPRTVVKSARQNTAAATKSEKGFVRRAVEAIAQAAAPFMPGSAEVKPKGD
jgi:hypothetical protein